MPSIDEKYADVSIELRQVHSWQPKGIIHVGANHGGEVVHYSAIGAAPNLFIEAIPEVYEKCRALVEQYPGNHALNAVCGKRDGDLVVFNVSSNPGAVSSSYLPIGDILRKNRPDITYVSSFEATTTRLDKLVLDTGFRFSEFNLLVMDVQGAELDVLMGSSNVLQSCEFVVSEVSDYELYTGGAVYDEITYFLRDHYFEPIANNFGNTKVGRRVGDVLYKRRSRTHFLLQKISNALGQFRRGDTA